MALVDELAPPQAAAIEVAGLNQVVATMPVYAVHVGIGDLPPQAALLDRASLKGLAKLFKGRFTRRKYA